MPKISEDEMVYEVGVGVTWVESDNIYYGIITDIKSSHVVLAPVDIVTDDMKCCYDGGAIRSRDEHNVRLKNCPPPFTELNKTGNAGIYAYADPKHPLRIKYADFELKSFQAVDDFFHVPKPDMALVFNHPWFDEVEKGVTYDDFKREEARGAYGRMQTMINNGVQEVDVKNYEPKL